MCDGLCLGALVAVGPLVQASLTNTVRVFDFGDFGDCSVLVVYDI